MSGHWKDDGAVPNIEHDILNAVLPSDLTTNTHRVVDTETGQERLVCVEPGQTVGEAIANGQWED